MSEKTEEPVAIAHVNVTEEQRQQWAALYTSAIADHEVQTRVFDALEMIYQEAKSNRLVDDKYVKANLELVAEEMDIIWPEEEGDDADADDRTTD